MSTAKQTVLDAFGKYEVPQGWLGRRTHDDMAGIAVWAVAEWITDFSDTPPPSAFDDTGVDNDFVRGAAVGFSQGWCAAVATIAAEFQRREAAS